jgi:uncharacterized Zn-finger protein
MFKMLFRLFGFPMAGHEGPNQEAPSCINLKCGRKIKADTKICPYCGTRQF